MELKWWLVALTTLALVACGSGSSTDPSPVAPAGAASASIASSSSAGLAGRPIKVDLKTTAGSSAIRAIRPIRSVPGELLVKFRATSRATALSVLGPEDRVRVQSVHTYRKMSGLHRIKLAPGSSVKDAIAAYSAKPEVEYAEPNYIVSASAAPDDPDFASQWSLQNTGQLANSVVGSDIHATDAWDITTGDPRVYIGVIDSGVDYTHADLAANIYSSPTDCNNNGVDDDHDGYIDDCHGIDTVNHDSDPMDDNGHGTHVAGIIGAVGNNGLGVSGVAWHVTIVPCKFLDATGSGSVADAIECLDWIVTLKDNGLNIVATNNSWGDGVNSQALHDAIARQLQSGILFVAAAGNDDRNLSDASAYQDGSFFPCGYSLPNIICVGASDPSDNNWTQGIGVGSNYGRQNVDIVAPGENILSTLPGNQYGTLTGTSMAAPHVTGTIALLKSEFPAFDWRAVRNRILASGDMSAYLDNLSHQAFNVVSQRRLDAASALTCSGSTVTARTAPSTLGQSMSNWHVGEALTLAVLNINCENPNGVVTVTVQPGNVSVVLQDDGNGADMVAGDGIYTATWTPTAGGTYTLAFPGMVYDPGSETVIPDTVTVNVDALLKPGFPVRTFHGGGTFVNYPPPVVGNVDSTPDLEILVAGYAQGPNYLWKSNGTLVSGWPLDPDGFDPTDPLSVQSPGFWSMGNLAGTADELELVGGFEKANALSPIEVRFGTGVMLPNWPRVAGANFYQSATLVDVDRDGLDEIFYSPDARELVGLHSDASLVSGFPVQPADVSFSDIGSPIAADLDLDGTPELIVGADNTTTGQIIAVRADGTRLAGFPVAVSSPPNIGGVGDVDGDGQPEIIATADRTTSGGGIEHDLIEVGPDGTVKRTLAEPAGATIDALADLDGDGIPEIVLSWGVVDTFYHTEQRFLNVIHGDGTSLPGWPKQLPKITEGATSQAVVGDVDGDGKPDIVIIAQTQLHVLGPDGTYAAGFPRQLPDEFVYNNPGYQYTPIIADVDAIGHNNIIVTSNFWNGIEGWYNRVWVYDLQGPAVHGPIEWGQEREGPAHRGFYQLGKNLAGSAYLATRVSGGGSVVAQGGAINCGTSCLGLYAKGTAVTLTANAANGQTFTGWLGACAGQGNPCTVTVQKFTSTVAEFNASGSGSPTSYALTTTVSGSGTGSITSQPSGISCPTSCSGQFATNTSVTLTAAPNVGSVFGGWSGACTGSATTCVVSMSSAQSVGASFSLEPVLTVSVTGNGTVTSNPAGVNCGSSCAAPYASGTSVTLTASPASGSLFGGWSGGGCSGVAATCTVVMNAATTVNATFTPLVMLSVATSGTGSGQVTSNPAGIDCSASCSNGYASGTSIVLSASPAASSAFTGWSGACSGSGPTCSVMLGTAQNVGAEFTLRPTLTVVVSGTGSVASSPNGIACGATCSSAFDPNAVVTLTASAAAGNTFVGWSGACTGASASCSVTLAAAASVTATFNAVSSGGGSSGAGAGGGAGGGGGGAGGGGGGGGGRMDWIALAFLGMLIGARHRRGYPRAVISR